MSKGTHDYDGVTVLSANSMEDLAELETRLVQQVKQAGMSLELLPVAKHVRVYRRGVS